MNRFACIFPGQGSQYIGMGKDIFDLFPEARETFRFADDVLGFSISRVCFEGPEEDLRQTRYTQVAILVHSVAVWRVLECKLSAAEFFAGHSVGEYSALVASGALEFKDALNLVRLRAEAMQEAGERSAGGMVALIGAEEDALERLLGDLSETGTAVVANFNSPGQVVISGDLSAIEKAIQVAKDYGVKKAIRLNVSGAFHSPLMEYAQAKLSAALRQTVFRDPRTPVVSNVTARPVRSGVEILGLLEKQLQSPVLWHQSMVYTIEQGITRFVEVGPGDVLCGLLKRIDKNVVCYGSSNTSSIEKLLREVFK
ncbi:MAG: ACP S-malonyltransferase [bacterium]